MTASSHDGTRRAVRSRRVLAASAFLITLLALPAVPAAWATLTHPSLVGENYTDAMVDGPDYTYATEATLVITGCSRGALLLNWDCYGSDGDDPHLRLANDFRPHHRGDRVDVNVELRGHPTRAYHWGLRPAIAMTLFCLGFALACGAWTSALIRRGSMRVQGWMFVLAALCLAPIATTALG
jgi:hypothetical protein